MIRPESELLLFEDSMRNPSGAGTSHQARVTRHDRPVAEGQDTTLIALSCRLNEGVQGTAQVANGLCVTGNRKRKLRFPGKLSFIVQLGTVTGSYVVLICAPLSEIDTCSSFIPAPLASLAPPHPPCPALPSGLWPGRGRPQRGAGVADTSRRSHRRWGHGE